MNDAVAAMATDDAQEQQAPDRDENFGQDAADGEHARPRKRTRMACDKCSTSRTRCDGQYPCRRCHDYGYKCHYNRQIKKRGRVPRNGGAAQPDQEAFDIQDAEAQENQGPLTQPLAVEMHDPASAPDHEELDQPHPLATPLMEYPPGHNVAIHHRPSQVSQLGFEAVSDPSDGPSPPILLDRQQAHRRFSRPRASFSTIIHPHAFGPFSPHASEGSAAADVNKPASRSGLPNSGCRYRCLEPLMPYLGDTLPSSVACDLFDVFLIDPGTSLFHCASPYILTRIFRKQSLLHPTQPRQLTPALLATILWCCAQTADISLLLVPGSRSRVANALYELATFLVMERDPDRWRRIHGGLRVENEHAQEQFMFGSSFPNTTESNEPAGGIDDVLTFLLLCIGVSGGDFKSDSNKWWSKAVRLALSLRLNREDEDSLSGQSTFDLRYNTETQSTLVDVEAREERRRVFWLLYSLDRHLALSFNRTLQVPDSCCQVFSPLPEDIWENLDDAYRSGMPPRSSGPPTNISGASFFQYFLPLMVILGDIIEAHHYQNHPRLGRFDTDHTVSCIASMISQCEASLQQLAQENELHSTVTGTPMLISNLVTRHDDSGSRVGATSERKPHYRLVIAYSTHILHVLHVLLHGKWDAISMLDNEDDWITTPRFAECASHAIAASEAVSDILKLDPELTFMPYLFGIYLLHGSFILLLFADRMPQLGPNQSVEQACETIIRAHEVCVVTLTTEFQRNFRRVVRSTLYSVQGASPAGWEEHKLARRRVLSLYRWTKGAKGLGI